MKGTKKSRLAIIGLIIVILACLGAVAVFAFAATGQASLFKENLILTSNDDNLDLTYNGQEITVENKEIEIESGSLAPGDYLAIEPVTETYLNAGQYDRKFKYKILDINGNDVTSMYNISEDFGEVNIKQRKIDINLAEGVDPSTINDGDVLSQDQLIIGGSGVASSDRLTAKVHKRVNGETYNFTYDFSVYNYDYNKDVTDSYALIVEVNFANRPDLDIPPLDEWPEDMPFEPGDVMNDLDAPHNFDELPIDEDLNVDLFAMNADKAGVYYFRGKSYGDYTGTGFEAASGYERGTVSPLEYYTTYIKDESSKRIVNIMPSSNISVSEYDYMPIFSESEEKCADDVSYSMTKRDGTYSAVCYMDVPQLKLSEVEKGVIDSSLSSEERRYSSYVYSNYTYIDFDLRNSLLAFINEKGIDTSSLQAFSDDLFNLFLNEYQYDFNGFGNESITNNVLSFLTETKKGNCQNYAGSAVMLYRTIGYPARFVTGVRVPYTEPNKPFAVKALYGHAWCEIYISGSGWIPLEYTVSSELDFGFKDDEEQVSQDENVTGETSDIEETYAQNMPTYDYLFDVQASETGEYYLREENYGNLTENGFDDVEVYNISDNPNPNEFISYQLAASGYQTRQINISYPSDKPTRDKELVSTYPLYQGTNATNDVYYDVITDENGAVLNDVTMTDINYDFYSDPSILYSLTFNGNRDMMEAEENYYSFAKVYYTDVPVIISNAIQQAILKNSSVLPTNPEVIISLLTQILQDSKVRFNPFVEYDLDKDNFQNEIISIINQESVDVNSFMISSAANVVLRSLDVPSRVVGGYLYIADSTEKKAISELNKYYWNEVYFEGYGWVRVDFTKSSGKLDSKYYLGKTKVDITTQDITKEYDGEAIHSDPVIEDTSIFPENHAWICEYDNELINVGSEEAKVLFEVYDTNTANADEVTYMYALNCHYGTLTISAKTITVYTKNISTSFEEGKVISAEVEAIDGLDENLYVSIEYDNVATLDETGSIKATLEIAAIYNAYGDNIVNNFNINYVYGDLEMY